MEFEDFINELTHEVTTQIINDPEIKNIVGDLDKSEDDSNGIEHLTNILEIKKEFSKKKSNL